MTGETVADLVLETFTSPDGKERVLIVQRLDGAFSFLKQGRTDPKYRGWGDGPWPRGFEREDGWEPPGDYSGIYDTAQTAVWEALCRVEWLSKNIKAN
jgi:hypothetical protein